MKKVRVMSGEALVGAKYEGRLYVKVKKALVLCVSSPQALASPAIDCGGGGGGGGQAK